MIAETVFQSIDSSVTFIGLILLVSMIVQCVISARLYRALNNAREMNDRLERIAVTLEKSNAHLQAMRKYYEPEPPPVPKIEPRKESMRGTRPLSE